MKPGFINLNTPSDLFEKLLYDFERLKKEPDNTYMAFDFFVTASHLADWINDGENKRTREFRESHPIMLVCDHLGCSGKHFKLKNDKHNSVDSADLSGYVEPGYVEDGYVEDRIEIFLSPEKAESLGVSNPVDVLELAAITVSFWKRELASSGKPDFN